MIRHLSKPIVCWAAIAGLALAATKAEAIPAFARSTKLGCNTCHTIFPQLTRFGRDFRDNGFRTPDEIDQLRKKTTPPPTPPPTTDEFWSFIPDQIPLSIQAKLHDAINPKGNVKSDFQIEELQLQSGGTITPRLSFYIHHHLVEEGAPGKLYTGWVRFNNLGGSDWLNLTVGQFELPLSFSPEIERLSAFGYLAFDRQLGANPWTVGTPQLGAQIFGQSARGTKIWAGVVNGSGLANNDTTQSFDNNSFKDVFARVTQEIGESSIGGYVYYGRGVGNGQDAGTFDDNFIRTGADASLAVHKLTLNATLLYGRDDNALGTGERRTFYGGFVEGDCFVSDRTVVLARFDGVHQSRPAAFGTGDQGGSSDVFRVNTLAFTPGIQWLARPNVKLGFEYQVRQAREEDRALAQLHLSF